MKTHDLKTWPEPFQAIIDGRKRYEIRANDRGFEVGDLLLLREWRPGDAMPLHDGGYTGRWVEARVTYMTPGGEWSLPEGTCVLSITVEKTGQPCTDNSPPWFTGRWRDWHRGHGCDKDDGRPRTAEGAAEIARGGR